MRIDVLIAIRNVATCENIVPLGLLAVSTIVSVACFYANRVS